MIDPNTRRFHGLFIGVDRHIDPAISELRFAERDASAMHALFADNLGEGTLLHSADATRERLLDEFAALALAGEDDVVVISFSGHGSETHELVLHDTDTSNLGDTGIPLEQLTDLFAAIPARRLLFVLDCCFSGALGAKVLAAPERARGGRSVAETLDMLAGEGRVILTASSATQPAWEQAALGHGLLTASVIEALCGPAEIRDGDGFSVMRMLDFVVRNVVGAARRFHRDQHPAVRGTFDGEVRWPIMTRGRRYLSTFPEFGLAPATSSPRSLADHGVAPDLVESWQRDIPELNELQLSAINEFGVLRGKHLVVSAPTSSGKTMVGELAALKGVAERKRAWFLLPLKALVNDKHEEFSRRYGELGVRTIRATGDFDDEVADLLSGRYDLCLMTYEKAAALALAYPHLLEGVGTVVVDEVQMIIDDSRGTNLEFLMTLLRARRADGVEPQLIALSAVIGDTGGLDRWLDAGLLLRSERPVPLDEGVLGPNGSVWSIASDGGAEVSAPAIVPRYGKGSAQDLVIPLVELLVGRGEQVIVFRNEKGKTAGAASYLARALRLPAATDTLAALPEGDPSAASQTLREVLAGGVAFHNAGLSREERLAVEEGFRSREIRVIVATTTLAMGVNTPASSVVIVELAFWNRPFTVAEYKNMVGRAGRLGLAERGQSFVIAASPADVRYAQERYVKGTPEDLRSRFFDSDLRALILRALAAGALLPGAGIDAEQLAAFLANAFGVFQRGGRGLDPSTLRTHIAELVSLRFISADADGTLHLEPLGRLAGESGTEIETLVRVAGAAHAVGPNPSAEALIALTQLTVELDEVALPTNARSKQEQSAWFGQMRRDGLAAVATELMRRRTDAKGGVKRNKRAAACGMWITGMPRAELEARLMRHHRDRDAAGAVEAVATRTADLVTVVGQVVDLVSGTESSAAVDEARLRLSIGIPRALVGLAACCGRGLSRSQYLRLHADGLGTIEALGALEDDEREARVGRTLSDLVALQAATEQ